MIDSQFFNEHDVVMIYFDASIKVLFMYGKRIFVIPILLCSGR